MSEVLVVVGISFAIAGTLSLLPDNAIRVGVLLVLALIYLLWQLVDVKLWKQARVEFRALQQPPSIDPPRSRTALTQFGASRTPIKIQAWRQK